MDRFRRLTGASSVMVARAAQWNCSVFRADGLLSLDQVIPAYLRLAIEYDSVYANTKYCIQMMLRDQLENLVGRRFLDSRTVEEIRSLSADALTLSSMLTLRIVNFQPPVGCGSLLCRETGGIPPEIVGAAHEFAEPRRSGATDQTLEDGL